MLTSNDLNQKILDIHDRILKDFPELSKYLNEMPVHLNPKSDTVDLKSLKVYYESLVDLVNKYEMELKVIP